MCVCVCCLVVRFSREAASVLDLLSAYQKRQIVEFLPYHHCDMMNHQSPDLDCLIELQARYTQYRHTIFLTGTFQHWRHTNTTDPVAAGLFLIWRSLFPLLRALSREVTCLLQWGRHRGWYRRTSAQLHQTGRLPWHQGQATSQGRSAGKQRSVVVFELDRKKKKTYLPSLSIWMSACSGS